MAISLRSLVRIKTTTSGRTILAVLRRGLLHVCLSCGHGEKLRHSSLSSTEPESDWADDPARYRLSKEDSERERERCVSEELSLTGPRTTGVARAVYTLAMRCDGATVLHTRRESR